MNHRGDQKCLECLGVRTAWPLLPHKPLQWSIFAAAGRGSLKPKLNLGANRARVPRATPQVLAKGSIKPWCVVPEQKQGRANAHRSSAGAGVGYTAEHRAQAHPLVRQTATTVMGATRRRDAPSVALRPPSATGVATNGPPRCQRSITRKSAPNSMRFGPLARMTSPSCDRARPYRLQPRRSRDCDPAAAFD